MMIKLTRLNGLEFTVNAELIEFVESTPDTVLTLTTGKKFVIKETVDEVVEKVIAYRRTIGTKITYLTAPRTGQTLESE